MTYLERSVHLRSKLPQSPGNPLSHRCAMPAPPKEELLRISRSVQIKLPPRGSWQSHQALPERVRPAQGTPNGQSCPRQTARPPRVRGSLAGSSFYGLHACRVFHGGFTAGFVRQALHAAGVRGHGGQGEHEPAPLALLALHPDLPAGKVHPATFADVQAKASAPGRAGRGSGPPCRTAGTRRAALPG